MQTVNGTFYRVIEMIVQPPGLLPTSRTLWRGDDLDQLAEAYPEHDLFFSDLSEVSTGSVIRIIEQQLENGRWEICEYPRITRVDPVFRVDLIDIADCSECLDSGCYHCRSDIYPAPQECVLCDYLILDQADGKLCATCARIYLVPTPTCVLCGNEHTDPLKSESDLCACCDAGKGRPIFELRWGHFDPDLPHRGSRNISKMMVGARTFRR